MSFILDALRKSESERQRQSGPALFEVKVAPPKSRVALWVAVLGALLLVNLGVITWVFMRAPRATSPETVAHAPAPAANPTPLAAPSSVQAPPSAPQPAPAGSAPRSPPPNDAGPSLAQAGYPSGPGQIPAPTASAQPSAPSPEPAASDAGARDGLRNEDDVPAVEPPRPSRSSGAGVTRGTEAGLPSYQDAAAAPGAGMPQLKLDLNAYNADPASRFVFINMTKLREGDSLPEGVRVESITPDGPVLSFRGSRFVLQR
jgi:general secretion pathway protein B